MPTQNTYGDAAMGCCLLRLRAQRAQAKHKVATTVSKNRLSTPLVAVTN
jgi:hypothetical protein